MQCAATTAALPFPRQTMRVTGDVGKDKGCTLGFRRVAPSELQILQDWAHVGPGATVQVLDEPGIPDQPGDEAH